MSLSDALSVLSTIFKGILGIYDNTVLFGTSLSVYIIAAFIAKLVMNNVFDIQKQSPKAEPKEKRKSE